MVALIATNGLFVAAEFGLTTVDRSKLRRLAASGDQRAGGVLAAVQELSLQLSGAQLGITLTSLLLGLVAEPVLARLLDMPLQALGLPDAVADAGAVVLALLLATVVQMLFGELVPQDLAIARPLGTALAITPLQRGHPSAPGSGGARRPDRGRAAGPGPPLGPLAVPGPRWRVGRGGRAGPCQACLRGAAGGAGADAGRCDHGRAAQRRRVAALRRPPHPAAPRRAPAGRGG